VRLNERKVALLYNRFTTAFFRVLSGSPNLTNLGTGGAWFGFHAREKPADYGSRMGSPMVFGSHPLIRFVPVLLITTVACVLRWCLSNDRVQPRREAASAGTNC